MKFLGKTENSLVLKEELTYKAGQTGNNKRIKELLLQEQKNFCAYTEKYIQKMDACEIEHFNASKKYADNYYNYYAVLRSANLFKKDVEYADASFFQTLFFQDSESFNRRIRYSGDGYYEESDENDQEARDLIDFLGFNHEYLYEQRKKHIARLKRNFKDASYTKEKCLEYFHDFQEDLSFITAIEIHLGLDLSEFYT